MFSEAPEHTSEFDERVAKRTAMLKAGIDPYPASVTRSHSLREITATWDHLGAGEESTDRAQVVGRVINIRDTGRLIFIMLQDELGARLQLMVGQQHLEDDDFARLKRLLDLGDHMWSEGMVARSRRGELSIQVHAWAIVSKALRSLPTLHHELNAETRARARYLDLIVSADTRELVIARSRTVRTIRAVLEDRGFTEIDTPILQLIHGGARARPFRTHFRALDTEMTLRIALELNLKKAVVGGMNRVFELGRIFRNEGLDATHSPEFTMLEAYEGYGDQYSVADLTKRIILSVAEALGITEVPYSSARTISLHGDWRWLTVHDAISEAVGEDVPYDVPAEKLRGLADRFGVEVQEGAGAGEIALQLVDELVEPKLVEPTFLCDYPAIAQPLARPHRSKPGLVEAWDLIIGGVERATGFSEMIDPVVQREILTEQSLRAAGGDPEAMELDESFLEALEHGAPPMGGIGIGLERLIMLFHGVGIRDTQLFPHTRRGILERSVSRREP